jgi:hypothetical protein
VDEGPHRPPDDEYWLDPWSRVVFSGDVFEAIPFGNQPTTVLSSDDPEPTRHYVGEVAFGYGLLISPTCDMYDQLADEPRPAHPYRVLVPILSLAQVAEATDAVERNVDLLRSRDTLHAYMYLPALEGHFDESVACLFRPSLVSDEFLADPPRRIQQMHPEARRQLKIKLAAYWARVRVPRDELPLNEQDEELVRSGSLPASVYDVGPEGV